jgi:hypothetical protein
MSELALQPASSAQARMPPTARERCEAGSMGVMVATAGLAICSVIVSDTPGLYS